MKICTVVGARPQFIKAAMVSKAIREYNSECHSEPKAKNPVEEVLIHTGQHYDYQMSQVFFDQLDIPESNYHLEIGSGSHGDQTGRMLAAIEKVLLDEKPDAALVYGDTNSTLAGALAASKLHIPVGHVEGGMRSFNRKMPEEINRVLTDHIAKWHFCPNDTAVKNLNSEGITEGVHLVGDVMYDAITLFKDIARSKSDILKQLGLSRFTSHDSRVTKYALATLHRAENTDDPIRLRNILEALIEISKDMPVVLPLHPRTRKAIEQLDISPLCKGRLGGVGLDCHPERSEGSRGVMFIEPLSYLDMLQLEQHASVILTDSGGMQKEAFWFGVPCVTMRDETEWIETVEAGWNRVTGADKNNICGATKEFLGPDFKKGNAGVQSNLKSASKAILTYLTSGLWSLTQNL